MKYFVTGGAGFIGSHLIDLLISKGYKVVTIDNLSLGRIDNINHLMDNKNFKFIKEDLLHVNELKKIFQVNGFVVVFNLAANSDI